MICNCELLKLLTFLVVGLTPFVFLLVMLSLELTELFPKILQVDEEGNRVVLPDDVVAGAALLLSLFGLTVVTICLILTLSPRIWKLLRASPGEDIILDGGYSSDGASTSLGSDRDDNSVAV